ncbi:hypothetical protein M3Y97_00109500 [Aphelenchoides bicaudatus]|nr:hypothetical protein M3Y97_00109500 [Aphelenchoides bicaudatus]
MSKFITKCQLFVPLFFVKYENFEQQVHSAFQVGKASLLEASFIFALLIVLIPLVILHKRQNQPGEEKVTRPDQKWLWVLLADFFIHFVWFLHDVFLFFATDLKMRTGIIFAYLFAREVLPIMYGFCVVLFDSKLQQAVFKPFISKQPHTRSVAN